MQFLSEMHYSLNSMTTDKKLNTEYNWTADLKKSKNELAKISPTFCLAKWLQVTLHLHKGTIHSCHHSRTHDIQLSDIQQNPSGLHNTQEKLNQRKLMLEGKQPKDCEYCWNIENSNAETISDRVMKSSSDWAFPYANEVVSSGVGPTINPRYLEISFSNLCNFKCSYCSADYSTKWQQEISQFGPYSSGNGSLTGPVIDEATNPYIETFWKWWPTLKNDLHVFRITGGEPLLSQNTWKILDDIDRSPAPHLQIAINSNLGVPTDVVLRLISKLKKLLAEKKVAGVRLFTSIDTFGKDAEIIRHGLDSELFFKHLNLILKEVPSMRVVIMVTYCALSVLNYTKLLEVILEMRKKYINSERTQPIGVSTNYLRYPEHLSVKILEKHLVKFPKESLEFMRKNQYDKKEYPVGFTEIEINSMKNLIEWFQSPIEETKKKYLQNQFRKFYLEHDLRRMTSSKGMINQILPTELQKNSETFL
jgi:organic radical activating enzyme